VVETLLRHAVTSGFGIPSIHNIALYEVLRQTPQFQHWVVRHEQAAGFAADGFYRSSSKMAAIFASTGPGNLFTLVPLLESLQSQTPVVVIGTNIASSLLAKSGGALHETPAQLEIIRPLTRFAAQVRSPDQIIATVVQALRAALGPPPGPVFVEIPHDLLQAAVAAVFPDPRGSSQDPQASVSEQNSYSAEAVEQVIGQINSSAKPVMLVGGRIASAAAEVVRVAERLQCPVFNTTAGKGMFAADHPLSLGCISRQGTVQQVLSESDLLLSFGARLTEFDTGQFRLRFPAQHIQVVEDAAYAGTRFPSTLVTGRVQEIARRVAEGVTARPAWCDVAATKAREADRLEGLGQEAYAALVHLRSAMRRDDVLVNDQSILNYWASAFFPVLEPGTFLYPLGSGTLGYALPAAIGAAFAIPESGKARRIVCIAGDGGFQYTQHELATLAQYGLPVKILLVNDEAYGVIGFLQRAMFGQTHEVTLKNPDFCRVAEAYGIRAERVTSLERLRQRLPDWLDAPGPALLEWRTELKAPWETGAILRPGNLAPRNS
jgi:thiamine pyrophosphate-dependent acetolactate synthase large subunit-like protein